MKYEALRKVLRTGAIVFGLSALFLLILPSLFLELLGLTDSPEMVWATRMIGIALLALAGNMWNNAGQASDERVGNVAKVMCASATALGVLTLLIPGVITWFSYLYAAVGFGFGIAYLFNLVRK